MYDNSDDYTIAFIVFSIIGLLISYAIIKGAVSSATKRIFEQVRLQNDLLIELLKHNGVEDAVIENYMDVSIKSDELRQMASKFNVSIQEIKIAMEQVGNNKHKVEEYLKQNSR